MHGVLCPWCFVQRERSAVRTCRTCRDKAPKGQSTGTTGTLTRSFRTTLVLGQSTGGQSTEHRALSDTGRKERRTVHGLPLVNPVVRGPSTLRTVKNRPSRGRTKSRTRLWEGVGLVHTGYTPSRTTVRESQTRTLVFGHLRAGMECVRTCFGHISPSFEATDLCAGSLESPRPGECNGGLSERFGSDTDAQGTWQ